MNDEIDFSSISCLKVKIERIAKVGWRGTPTAIFNWIRDGQSWFMVEVWFEDDLPKMQIRSGAQSLEEAAVIAQAIHMAIEWATDEITVGKR